MERIEISRSEFEDRFGYRPALDVEKVLFYDGGSVPTAEYVLKDDEMAGESPMEVAELERIWKL